LIFLYTTLELPPLLPDDESDKGNDDSDDDNVGQQEDLEAVKPSISKFTF